MKKAFLLLILCFDSRFYKKYLITLHDQVENMADDDRLNAIASDYQFGGSTGETLIIPFIGKLCL